MTTTMLDAALWYSAQGYSVIPCKADKTPAIESWKAYQEKPADNATLTKWFGTGSSAPMLAILTGKISGIDVVDCDNQEAYDKVNELLPDSIHTRTIKTPRGYHLYFQHRPGLVSRAKYMPETDIKTNGGYVIAPPSVNAEGLIYKAIVKSAPAPWPEDLFQTMMQFAVSQRPARAGDECQPDSTITLSLEKGSRNETLFHIANKLAKAGESEGQVRFTLDALNLKACLSDADIARIVKSAMDRNSGAARDLTNEIKTFFKGNSGWFRARDVANEMGLKTVDDRHTFRTIIARMAEENKIIERDPARLGYYRLIAEDDKDDINFLESASDPVDITLPLNLHQIAKTYAGEIILIQGVTNTGKTAFALDTIAKNMKKMDIQYFNNEMEKEALRNRLDEYRAVDKITDWKFKARRHPATHLDWPRKIKPGPGVLNIIDYMNPPAGEIWRVGEVLESIAEKLDGAVCMIMAQRDADKEHARGGESWQHRPRLVINLNFKLITVKKCKHPVMRANPNGMWAMWDLVDGWRPEPLSEWMSINDKEAKMIAKARA